MKNKICKAKLALAVATSVALVTFVKNVLWNFFVKMPMFSRMFYRHPGYEITKAMGKKIPMMPYHGYPHTYPAIRALFLFVAVFVGVWFAVWFYEKLTEK